MELGFGRVRLDPMTGKKHGAGGPITASSKVCEILVVTQNNSF